MNTARIMKALLAVGVIAACMCGIVACSSNGGDAINGTAATVNGVDISEETVTKQVEHVRSQSGLTDDEQWGKFLVQNDMTAESVRSDIIDTLIEEELIKEGADELGITVDSTEVDEAVATFKENFSSEEAWQKALDQAGFTEESYYESIEGSMIQQKVGEHFNDEAEVTDEDYVTAAKTYASSYDGAKRIAQIVFTSTEGDEEDADESDEESSDEAGSDESSSSESAEASAESASAESADSGESASSESASSESSDASAESSSSESAEPSEASASAESASGESASSASAGDDSSEEDAVEEDDESSQDIDTSAAKTTADSVLAQINAGALDFADAARQYSTDEDTAENGGEMGWDKLLTLEDDYTNALTDLEAGQVSEVIEGSDGSVFILKVLEVYDAPESDDITSLDQIPEAFHENIKEMAVSVKANSLYTDWLDGLKEGADKQINDMPSGLPYDIDLTPYQEEKDEDSEDEDATEDEDAVEDDAAAGDDVTVDADLDADATAEDEAGLDAEAAEATVADATDATATDAAAIDATTTDGAQEGASDASSATTNDATASTSTTTEGGSSEGN